MPMTRLPTYTLIMIATLSALLPTASAMAESLSFSEARDHLLDHSDQLRAANASVAAWTDRESATRWLRTPRVDFNAQLLQYERDIEQDLPQPYPDIDETLSRSGLRSTVSAQVPLYTGGEIPAVRNQAHHRRQQAIAERRTDENEQVRTLVDLYFGVQFSAQYLAIQHDVVHTLEAHTHRAQRFHEQGLISQLDHLDALTALDRARRDLEDARQDDYEARAALRSLLHQSRDRCLSTPLALASSDTDSVARQMHSAFDHNPGLHTLDAVREQARAQVQIERSALLPDVFGFAQYELNPDMTPVAEPDWAVGVGIRWSLSTGVSRRQMISAAEADLDQVRALEAQARRDLSLAVDVSDTRLAHARQQLALLEADASQASEHLHRQQRAFELGQGTSLDVSEALLNVREVEVREAELHYRSIQALADLLSATGELNRLPEYLTVTEMSQESCA